MRGPPVYNSLIFSLLVPPYKIAMYGKYENVHTKIENYSRLKLKHDSKSIFARCVVYYAKPAATITWEYNGRKLDSLLNPDHCYRKSNLLNILRLHKVCTRSEVSQPTKLGLFLTESIVSLIGLEGQNNPNLLRCLAHHPALRVPMSYRVEMEVENKGKFKMQQILKTYWGIL